VFETAASAGPSARKLKYFFHKENMTPYAFPERRRTESSGEL